MRARCPHVCCPRWRRAYRSSCCSGFRDGVLRVVQDIPNYDLDVNVSVFETNIRVLGGLLSAHVLASDPDLYVQQQQRCMARL